MCRQSAYIGNVKIGRVACSFGTRDIPIPPDPAGLVPRPLISRDFILTEMVCLFVIILHSPPKGVPD
jgi:hypothetical protein